MKIGKFYVIKGRDSKDEGFICEAIMNSSPSRNPPPSYWRISKEALDATIFSSMDEANKVMEMVKKQGTLYHLEMGCVSMEYEKVK